MAENNTTRSFMISDYGDNKADKNKELNESMSISPSSRDEYTNAVHNAGGKNNA